MGWLQSTWQTVKTKTKSIFQREKQEPLLPMTIQDVETIKQSNISTWEKIKSTTTKVWRHEKMYYPRFAGYLGWEITKGMSNGFENLTMFYSLGLPSSRRNIAFLPIFTSLIILKIIAEKKFSGTKGQRALTTVYDGIEGVPVYYSALTSPGYSNQPWLALAAFFSIVLSVSEYRIKLKMREGIPLTENENILGTYLKNPQDSANNDKIAKFLNQPILPAIRYLAAAAAVREVITYWYDTNDQNNLKAPWLLIVFPLARLIMHAVPNHKIKEGVIMASDVTANAIALNGFASNLAMNLYMVNYETVTGLPPIQPSAAVTALIDEATLPILFIGIAVNLYEKLNEAKEEEAVENYRASREVMVDLQTGDVVMVRVSPQDEAEKTSTYQPPEPVYQKRDDKPVYGITELPGDFDVSNMSVNRAGETVQTQKTKPQPYKAKTPPEKSPPQTPSPPGHDTKGHTAIYNRGSVKITELEDDADISGMAKTSFFSVKAPKPSQPGAEPVSPKKPSA